MARVFRFRTLKSARFAVRLPHRLPHSRDRQHETRAGLVVSIQRSSVEAAPAVWDSRSCHGRRISVVVKTVAVPIVAATLGTAPTTSARPDDRRACRGVSGPILCLPLPRNWFSSVGPGGVGGRPASYLLAGSFRFPDDAATHEGTPPGPPHKVLISLDREASDLLARSPRGSRRFGQRSVRLEPRRAKPRLGRCVARVRSARWAIERIAVQPRYGCGSRAS